MKKILTILSLILIAFCATGFAACENGSGGQGIQVKDTDPELFEYYPLSDGTYLVSAGKTRYLDEIVIPSSYNGVAITQVGDFKNCSTLTTLIVPDSVTSIENQAFTGCPIENAKIPAFAISYIQKSNLKTVEITGCKSIEYVFDGCSSLTTVIIGNSVKSIGNNAFYNCSSLTSITIPDSVTGIGDNAFSGCSSLTSITIGGNVTSIGFQAFNNCSSLTSITIGNSVKSIENYAFSGCDSLTSATFINTSGWWVSTSSTATSGISVSVTDTSQNAAYLRSTYRDYFWKLG